MNIEDKAEAEERMPKIASMVDKLAKRNIIHKNKAGILKSRMARHIQALA
jgi:small subunit ribosomal protein S20